jgi:uroporphyrinogen decarboxylase
MTHMTTASKHQSIPTLSELASNTQQRLTLPIAVFPGVTLIGKKVKDAVTDAKVQAAAARALHDRYKTPYVLSAMDLSVESEAFGCTIMMSDDEVPTVTGSLITGMDQAKALRVPKMGAGRTSVYTDTVKLLAALPGRPLVLAGCIGPFSLAARLVGVSEAMMLTMTEPDLMHLLLAKSTEFLITYVKAFQAAGADGLIMAEPAAGLLSPKGLAEYSSKYVNQIREAVSLPRFSYVLHNCAAKTLHLPAILESGVKILHFGKPMDIAAALKQTPEDVFLCGNLDPSAVFVQSTPEQVRELVAQRLSETGRSPRYIVSSGCDIPARAPMANLDAFFAAAQA